jgi:hypothetical protein
MIRVISKQTIRKITSKRLILMESQSITAKVMGGRTWVAVAVL